ncbi:helix-turn-helix domain-containing protein [Rhizobium sp. Root1220]|uniref:helix-turn-helix domain-containing protein n=1 Tax=Rhizobium sp. Root1220 TaxID=1736432 RepID=UPI0006FAA7F3|nr:helix-turn-helix domain-containing protein [Rhizobium sp. Root1220]KQV79281.1 AraC family transcriptional regulator [Rhizobium sp. Root1220]
MNPLLDVRLPDNTSVEAGFPADHSAWNLGSMLIVQQTTPAHSYARSANKLRGKAIDHWHLVVLRTGLTWTECDGHVSEGAPGRVELRSLGYPFRGRTTSSQSLSFYMCRDLLDDASAINDTRIIRTFHGNYTNLLIDYFDSMEARLPSLRAADLSKVVRATRDMIATCVSSSAEHSGATEVKSHLGLMQRLRRLVQHRLSSTELTPDSLSKELGISRTRLYQLLEPSGGVLHYIQRRRLLSAHAMLSNPANRQQIVEIATDVGFVSAAHFSKAFSREFGYSPREARNLGGSRHFGAMYPPTQTAASAPSFEDWINLLGH